MSDVPGPATMLCVNHGTKITDHVTVNAKSSPVEMGEVIVALKEITQVIKEAADKPPAELRVPLPEFHNNVEVKPTPIEFVMPPVENRIEVNPTPITNRIEVSPTPIQATFRAPDVENNVRCDPVINFDTKSICIAIYVLSGVIFGTGLGLITFVFSR